MENEDLKKLKGFFPDGDVKEEQKKEALEELMKIIEENEKIVENLEKVLGENKK